MERPAGGTAMPLRVVPAGHLGARAHAAPVTESISADASNRLAKLRPLRAVAQDQCAKVKKYA